MPRDASKQSKREETISEAVERCLKRIAVPTDREYFRAMLLEMVRQKTIPIELLDYIPLPANEAGKTRFDQIYDAVMKIVFPGYRIETLRKFLGPWAEIRPNTKVWRAVFPDKYGISHVFLRANSYQEAFALACDYACRCSLRIYKKIPADLTIRVMFTSEKAIRRKMEMRWASRVNRRHHLQLVGRKFTPKEIAGARMAALGKPDQPQYRIAKYSEIKDLVKILHSHESTLISEVESESFKKKR